MTLDFSPRPPLQTFHTPSLGDEEFEIPPITPPPETESGLGLSDVDSPFPAMQEPPVPHRGPIIPQFPPQSLDLPSITISRNMMEQEGMSVNNGQPVVSSAKHAHPQQIKSLHLQVKQICICVPVVTQPSSQPGVSYDAFTPRNVNKSYANVAEISLSVAVSRSR